jgi:hypothetical protein
MGPLCSYRPTPAQRRLRKGGNRLPAVVGSVQDVPEYSLDVVGRGPVRVVLLEAPRVADLPLVVAGPVASSYRHRGRRPVSFSHSSMASSIQQLLRRPPPGGSDCGGPHGADGTPNA